MELLSFSLTAMTSKACFVLYLFLKTCLIQDLLYSGVQTVSEKPVHSNLRFAIKKDDASSGHLSWGIQTVHNVIVEIRVVLKIDREKKRGE